MEHDYVVVWTDNGGTHEEDFSTKEAAEDLAGKWKSKYK